MTINRPKFSIAVTLIMITVLLYGCSDNDKAEIQQPKLPENELAERINRIENGLMPNLQISGRTIANYRLEDRLKELGIPGLSVAFVANGKIEWAKGYGSADISADKPMTPETMLLAGSISKPLAALRALQLVEQGVLNLDANINDSLTSWQLPDNEFTANEKVTLRRILNHTAGLTVWGFPGYDKGDDIPSVIDVLDGKGNTEAVRVYKQPGESWQYSGGGYTIMQLAIDDNQPDGFVDSLQRNVLDPLGMKDSTFANPLPEVFHELAATGYRANGDEVEGQWPIYPEMAAAGLWTTASQLVLYGVEIQRIYQTGEDGNLSHAMVTKMLDAEPGSHGLGPSIDKFTFGHGGADEGFRAQLVAWKDLPYAVVIMVNSDNGRIMRELLLAIAKEYQLPGVEPTVKTVFPMAAEEINKFAGKFALGNGTFEFAVDGNGLSVREVDGDFTARLLPQSDNQFFFEDSGVTLTFEIKDNQAISFEVSGRQGTRVD